MKTISLLRPVLLSILCLCMSRVAAEQDDTNWILSHATTAPATQPDGPTTQPAVPLQPADEQSSAGRAGKLLLSNGQIITGQIRTTTDKPVRVWIEKTKEYRDIPFSLIRRIDATILWQREEREWHFKESGSDIKEYSGKTYPAREYSYSFTLINDQKVSGSVTAPLYVTAEKEKEEKTYILHKRDKGEIGQTLKDLIYVERVDFND